MTEWQKCGRKGAVTEERAEYLEQEKPMELSSSDDDEEKMTESENKELLTSEEWQKRGRKVAVTELPAKYNPNAIKLEGSIKKISFYINFI